MANFACDNMARRASPNAGRSRFDDMMAGNFLLYDSSSDSDNENNNEAPGGAGGDGGGIGFGAGYRQSRMSSTVWVFGYGSLCWNPGFEFSQCVTGYIRGYVRRFWQGNNSHRGTVEKVCVFFLTLFKK